MKLAQDEQLLKTWNYASSRQKRETQSGSLTVTNKRIISQISGNRETARQEIPLDSVKSLFMANRTPSKTGAVLLILLGIATLIFVVGLFFLIVGIKLLKRSAFMLMITTKGAEGEALEIGASSVGGKKKKNKDKGKVKVSVDKAMVKDMFDSLGAIIFTYQK